jgi:hypothetical protein
LIKTYEKQNGVPKFTAAEFSAKTKNYVLLIPIINEGERIINELKRAQAAGIENFVDIVICDGGSSDGSTAEENLQSLSVNTC